ncbi:MAG: glyoxalase [Ilumatobacter sp.]|uniref:glyoxalase n=1 Tax=Ilumatobacter sp. TaxID=1967498 RepID=UPI003299040F
MTSDFSGSTPEWVGIDHVQLAIPVGGEDLARSFYVDVLGLTEIPKPAVMAARGGAWFEAGEVRVHVGAEADFVPARKAHPALTVRGLEQFVESSGLDATWNTEIEGLVRCHVDDPFGNRIELIDTPRCPTPATRSKQVGESS